MLKEIGEGAGIQSGCRFLHFPKISIGARSVINFGCTLDGRHHPVIIGENVSIGPCATILTLGHDPQSPNFENVGGAVEIGDRAWIAWGAIVLPGVKIGEGAVVAAGAVVSRDVEPFSIVAGSPARKVGERNKDLHYELGYNPWLG